MKHLLLIGLLLLAVASCKKEISVNSSDYLTQIKQNLIDSLASNDFAQLDFSRAALAKVDSVGLYVLHIPFQSKRFEEDFVVLQTDRLGHINAGRIVHQTINITNADAAGVRKRADGQIQINSLKRELLVNSPIVNGRFTALRSAVASRTSDVVPGYGENVLPEVVIVYVRNTIDQFSWSAWNLLTSYFSIGGGGSSGYYSFFSEAAPGGGGGSGGGFVYTGGNPSPDPAFNVPMNQLVLEVDYENQDQQPEIDLQKFINCLTAIPDAGATCSIEILADIPVDSDPNKIFNIGSNSPGHVFLNIRKSNGSQSASQNIGFYPSDGWKTGLTSAPVDGKLVDNRLHEFNCGFKVDITPAQLQAAITQMLRSKDWQYDIDNYNCTDWALDVFNAAGGNLSIPLYDIPGNVPSLGTRMPNGVYNRLKQMKTANDPRSGGITIDILKGYAGNSTGPCN